MKNFFKVAKVSMLVMVCALFLGIGIKAEAAPGQVTGLKQTGANSGAIVAEWQVPAGDVKGYIYEICEDPKFENTATYYTNTATDPGVYLTGLDAGKSYYLRVRAIDVLDEAGPVSDVFEVVTAPSGKVKGLKQTKAGAKSITLSWQKVKGANVYDIAYYKASTQTAKEAKYYTTKKDVSSQSLTLAANTKYRVDVAPARKSSSGYVAYGANTSGWKDASTMPKKITKVKFLMGGSSTSVGDPKSDSQAKQAYFSWGRSDAAQGYEYTVYGSNGKKVLFKGTTKTDSPNRFVKIANKKLANYQFMKIKVRAYITVNGNKKYGPVSDDVWFAKFIGKTSGKVIRNNAANGVSLSWKKVTGAKNYTVYMSTTPYSGYKKVATASKTSCTIKKLGGQNFVSGRSYYYYVVANKKAGKKTFKSDDQWYNTCTIRTQYSYH